MLFVALTKYTLAQGPGTGRSLSLPLFSLPILLCWPPSCHWGLCLNILLDRPPWRPVLNIFPLDPLSTSSDSAMCSRRVNCLHCISGLLCLQVSCCVQPKRGAIRRLKERIRGRSMHFFLPSFIPVASLLPSSYDLFSLFHPSPPPLPPPESHDWKAVNTTISWTLLVEVAWPEFLIN